MKSLWYFSAPWCGPCKQFGPTMDRVAQSGVTVKKVDVDYTPDVTAKFGIKSVPTVILVENDQEKARFTGARSFEQVMEFYKQ
jgi:thioredoxin 1